MSGFHTAHPIFRGILALLVLSVGLLTFKGHLSSSEGVAVALFPFLPQEGRPSTLERTIDDLLAARVAAMAKARQVDPEGLVRSAAESGVDLERPFPAEKAAAIAAQAGAEVVILGRTRRVGEELVVVARIFGAGGSGSEEVHVSGSSVGRIAPLLAELADAVTGTLGSNRERFTGAGTDPLDVMSALREKVAGLDRPTVFLQVRESYGGNVRPESVTEAELVKFVEAAGIERRYVKSDAEVVIFAHAVGSPGTRNGALTNSDVSVEFRAVAPARGELLAVAATGHKAADIIASLAGTRAFSEATASVAPEFIHTLVRAWSSPAVGTP